MRLHQEISITEGQGPVPLKLTLGEIIRDGKVTNPYQIYTLGLLSEFFKNGLKSIDLHLETPVPYGSAATTTALTSALKSLSPADQVALAQYLSDCIDAGESALADQTMDIDAWTRLVLQKQD
jgi:hypothetical protein